MSLEFITPELFEHLTKEERKELYRKDKNAYNAAYQRAWRRKHELKVQAGLAKPIDVRKSRETARQWAKDNPERMRKASYDYARKHPLRNLVDRAKYRAVQKGMEFDITEKDLEQPKFCPVLGLELEYHSKGKRTPNTASLDRLDSSKGYVKGNVIVMSWRANLLKNNATQEELVKLAKWALVNIN